MIRKELMQETREEWIIFGVPASVIKIAVQMLLIIMLAVTAFNLGGVFAMENLAYANSCGNYDASTIKNISSGNWIIENKTVQKVV